MTGRKTAVILSLIITAAVAVAGVIGLRFNRQNRPLKRKGGVFEITETQTVKTNMTVMDRENMTAPNNSEGASLAEAFIREADTYESSSESPKTVTRGVFHVVTNGTVSDSKSLEGLSGPARTLGEIVLAAGFRYDKNQNLFYSDSNSWQRSFGFMPAYDFSAALAGMYYDTLRIKFKYEDYDYMFQLWKGRYGITTGAEMGLYRKRQNQRANFYGTVPDNEMMVMSFALYKGDRLYMTRGPERHWWLTGFKLMDVVAPKELTLHATYFMEKTGMADSLENSLKELGFIKDINYQRVGDVITAVWN